MKVDMIPVPTDDYLVTDWNRNAGKYDKIAMIFHSGPHAMSVGGGYKNSLAVKSEDLEDLYTKDQMKEMAEVEDLKKVNADIDLLSCNAGHLDHSDDNLANAFDSRTTGKVYASDGNVSYYPSCVTALEYINKIPLVNIDYDAYPEEGYEPRLSTVLNQDGFIDQLDKIKIFNREIPKLRTAKGFYYLDDGEITYD